MKKLMSLLLTASLLFVVACEKEVDVVIPQPEDQICTLVELATVVPFEDTEIIYEFLYNDQDQIAEVKASTYEENLPQPQRERWVFAYQDRKVNTVTHYLQGKVEQTYHFSYTGDYPEMIQGDGPKADQLIPVFENGKVTQVIHSVWNPGKEAYFEQDRTLLEWMNGNLMRYTFRGAETDKAHRLIYDDQPAPVLPLEVALMTDLYTYLSANNVAEYFAYDPAPYFAQVRIAYDYDYNEAGYPVCGTIIGDGRDVVFTYRCE